MKKNISKSILLLLLFVVSSCNILDQKSPNAIAEDEVFTTAAGAENALVGLYFSMQSRDYLGGNYLLFPDAYIGLAATGGYDVTSLDEFGAGEVTSQNSYSELTYAAIYRTIANANRLLAGLENLPEADFETGRKSRIAAEARFIRAMAHFDLLRWFGYYFDKSSEFGIPIVDRVTEFDEVIRRNTVSEVYEFIEKELAQIRGAFPDDEILPSNLVCVTTVDAFSARVKLYKKDYAAAYDLAKSIIERSEYSLFSAGEVASVYTRRNSPESIFELSFDIRNQSGYNSLTYGKDDAFRAEIFFMASADLDTFFQNRPGDSRVALLNFENNDESIQPDGRTEKYRGEATRDNPAYVFRLAEMHLIRTEAAFGIGSATHYDLLNEFRAARGLEAIVPVDAGDKTEFYRALADEIKAEFNFEGHYLFDVVRLGLFEDETGLEKYRSVFPIPEREISVSDGAILQNPGY